MVSMKITAGLIAWAGLCVAGYLVTCLIVSFVTLEWQWAGTSPFSRAILVALFTWIGIGVVKACPEVKGGSK